MFKGFDRNAGIRDLFAFHTLSHDLLLDLESVDIGRIHLIYPKTSRNILLISVRFKTSVTISGVVVYVQYLSALRSRYFYTHKHVEKSTIKRIRVVIKTKIYLHIFGRKTTRYRKSTKSIPFLAVILRVFAY